MWYESALQSGQSRRTTSSSPHHNHRLREVAWLLPSIRCPVRRDELTSGSRSVLLSPVHGPGGLASHWLRQARFRSSGSPRLALFPGGRNFSALPSPLTTRAPGASPAHANHRHRNSHTPSSRASHSPGKTCMCGPFSALHGSSQDRGGWSADKVGDGCQPWLPAHSAGRTGQHKARACRFPFNRGLFFSPSVEVSQVVNSSALSPSAVCWRCC